MKNRLVRSMMVAGLGVLAACGNDAAKIDELRKDLMLANGAYQYQPYMTPLEQGYGYAPRYQPVPNANGGAAGRSRSASDAMRSLRLSATQKRPPPPSRK